MLLFFYGIFFNFMIKYNLVVIIMLKIDKLEVKAQEQTILKDFNLDIKDGEIHVLMGPNGVGKSTISKTIMHHPDYVIENGSIIFNDININDLSTTEIARLGIFLLGQNPIEVEGISNAEMLRNVLSEKTGERVDIFKFNKKINEICEIINMPKEFVHRDINFNMSGGEKKKNELLHLFMLEPKFIILDEIDSGLDVDAIKVVGKALHKYYDMYKPSILIITHHAEILKYFDDYVVHTLKNGKIDLTGDKNLVLEIEKDGFRTSVITGDTKNE